jgi:cytochrome b involved in lipid metabolism
MPPDSRSRSTGRGGAYSRSARPVKGRKDQSTANDESVKVDGLSYDALKLATIHPGGEIFVRAFGGSDASMAFMSYHRRLFPHEK